MLGASVPREKAEGLRRLLSREHLVDKRHAIVENGDRIFIPLTSVPDSTVLDRFGASLVEGVSSPRCCFVDPFDEIVAQASIPDDLKLKLPRKWERLGDVVVIRLDAEFEAYETEIARAYVAVLGLKTMLREVGPITGDFRRPTMKLLFGTETETVHTENGVRYKLDVSDIMFSSGNQEERLRMAGLACDGETIVDMFAGIGYFSLPLAVHRKPRRVIACEINPKAHGYLVENIRLNGVGTVVEPVLGDNRDLPGEEIADRVLMGYVKTTHEFLSTALRLVKDHGVIHYHETCPNEQLSTRPLRRLEEAVRPGSVEVLRSKVIKSFAPGVSHVVMDVRVLKTS